MWRQAIDGAKIKMASFMALQKQRERVCDAAKMYRDEPTRENEKALFKQVKRLETMEAIQ